MYSYKPGLYLIEILHQTTTMFAATRLPFRLYLIEILHQTTTLKRFILTLLRCILSKFYIKPQQRRQNRYDKDCCILSKFYIKPQLRLAFFFQFVVVSYRNSTSNHNVFAASANFTLVVSYRNSTSNHNLATVNAYFNYVVSYRNSTSNHNSPAAISIERRLYLIEILHQTTTAHAVSTTRRSCILSKFYIKPQPCVSTDRRKTVVSYRNSTSNHNLCCPPPNVR